MLNLISKKRLWVLISIYILFIYVSLPFFPAFIKVLRSFISKELLNILSLVVSVLFFLLLSLWIYKKKYKANHFLLIISPLLLLTYLSLSLDVWVERIHFIEYAVLGLLISRAVNLRTLHGIIATCCLIILIGVVDEIIQWFLPNRVGDMRDVIMNSVGGLSGLWLGQFLYREQHFLKRNS
ncbi:MAG: VanZ family protein [SAR324 cluster bacterium]|nr:VanZ family protein [SAR324 cluster bacterium]MDP6245224.1 VanZ family protein [SAR324 cluster bacterium]